MSDIPATSYSTIFHCDQSAFVCILRAFEGLVSLGMFWLFYNGYRAISKQRNNKLSQQDKLLYQLAMAQTLMLTVYYLLFQQFFMLATIRNFLIWISINILHVFCLLYWDDDNYKNWINSGMMVLQVVNFLLWFFISLGEGSSLQNTDYNLGYNCTIIDWMIMSGILFGINLFSSMLGYFKISKLDWELNSLKQNSLDNSRKIYSTQNQRKNLLIIICSGLIGSFIMFGWDFLAYNGSVDRKTCEQLFSGDTVFRNILCFLLKIVTMQLNPSAIYYVMYYSRKEDFEQTGKERRLNEELINYFDDGASDMNRTVSGYVRESQNRQSSRNFSHYG